MKNLVTRKSDDYSMIFDNKEPNSLVNITPSRFSTRLMTVPRDFLDLGLSELEDKLKPTRLDRALKACFWKEYNRAMLTNTKMTLRGMHWGVCQEKVFIKTILGTNMKMAWLIQPNIEDEVRLQLLYDRGLERVEEILDSEIVNAKGFMDPKKAEVVLKAFKMLDDRVKGLAVQETRIKKESVQVNVNTNEDGKFTNREEVIQRIKRKMIENNNG